MFPPSDALTSNRWGKGYTLAELHYGFMETPDVPAALAGLELDGWKFDPMETTFFSGAKPSSPRRNRGWRSGGRGSSC